MDVLWIVLVIQGIIFGGFCSFIASQKDRDSVSWFLLGFFFSILAVLALVAIPKGNITDQPDAILRTCPYCAEQVKVQATICRFCQKDIPPTESASAGTNGIARLRITEVNEGEASKQGIQVGDVINTYKNFAIDSEATLSTLMEHYKGRKHTMKIVRGSEQLEFILTAGPLGIKTAPAELVRVESKNQNPATEGFH